MLVSLKHKLSRVMRKLDFFYAKKDADQFVSDLVGNPENRFSRVADQMVLKCTMAAPVAEWLRSLTSVLLIIRSSHCCGFTPRSGRESHVGQAKFCLRVCQVVFHRVLRFSPHLSID